MTKKKEDLRSKLWFANPDDYDMTALYIERYMNWGITREELQSGKPIIGIAQSGSDLSPCNRHHIILAERVREGIREAGGIAFEFPVHPEYADIVASSAPSPGYCNTMGTATTMNSLAEALGMSLPGSAAIPAVHKERANMAYWTGKRIVDMVWEDMKPSDIMTREAFENAIVANSAIGGSTNAPIHLKAIANHLGVKLDNQDWEDLGWDIPLMLNLQPAGEYLGEDYHHAGGLPAVVNQLMEKDKLPHPNAMTVNGKSIGENCDGAEVMDDKVIWPFDKPMVSQAGFLNLKGNLFNTAIMKTSVISDEFRERYLSNPDDPNAFEGKAAVFDGREDYYARINDESMGIDEYTLLFIRGAGPIGYPGGAEVVNMQPPDALLKRGISSLPCIGDGRQSGTSGSPSILNASPEAAVGGGLALIKTGDMVRIDLNKSEANILISDEELAKRQKEVDAILAKGRLDYVPDHQTPWQEIQRNIVDQFEEGMVLKGATKYRDVAKIVPRDNH